MSSTSSRQTSRSTTSAPIRCAISLARNGWSSCAIQILHNDFPPLRTANAVAAEHLPVQLSSFIGRQTEMKGIREALADNRLVTLTGAGGAGKTRLAIQVAATVATEFADGVWYVDLAPITDPDVVPVTVARALGLPDQPGQPTMDVLLRFIRDRQMLILLDNCEHLLDASAELIIGLLAACPALTLLATSREPIGVTGEVSWRVPSLSLADEAIELFSDRARRTKPEFRVTAENTETVTEICRRLDGLPLAIELAAARVRALSPAEILDSLHDRFRLLTGGARTAVRRQQTLRASVDWSHALLSEPEQVLFRRLAVFLGGFDLDAAQAVAGGGDVERYQVLDQLTLLVDKSLVVADDSRMAPATGCWKPCVSTRRKSSASRAKATTCGPAIATTTPRWPALLDAPTAADYERRIDWAETEIDNLRAAFAWSRENSDTELALTLASSLQPLWLTRGRIQEGLNWLGAALADETPKRRACRRRECGRLRTKPLLLSFTGGTVELDDAERTLARARELGDPALVARALTACGVSRRTTANWPCRTSPRRQVIARDIGDSWLLGQILALDDCVGAHRRRTGHAQVAAEEGLRIADGIGDGFVSRQCRYRAGLGANVRQRPARGRSFGWVRWSRSAKRRTTRCSRCMHRRCGRSRWLTRGTWPVRERRQKRPTKAHPSSLSTTKAPSKAFGIVHLAAGDASAAWEAFETARQRLRHGSPNGLDL